MRLKLQGPDIEGEKEKKKKKKEEEEKKKKKEPKRRQASLQKVKSKPFEELRTKRRYERSLSLVSEERRVSERRILKLAE